MLFSTFNVIPKIIIIPIIIKFNAVNEYINNNQYWYQVHRSSYQCDHLYNQYHHFHLHHCHQHHHQLTFDLPFSSSKISTNETSPTEKVSQNERINQLTEILKIRYC